MTLIWRRLTREKVAIAIMRFIAGQEHVEEGASRLHTFSRVWFVFFASAVPMALVFVGALSAQTAVAAGAVAFGVGALYLVWFLFGGLDELVYRVNRRIAEERRPWWNRKP
jgi:hypothetical protein